jgi:biopolymer transport protein ExbD
MSRLRSIELQQEGSESGVDISPLIDCVFILLIFFIVTTTFVKETGVEVNKPQAASAAQLERNSIMLALTKEGQVVYGGQQIGFSGIRPLVRRQMQKEDVPVIIKADRDSPSGQLVRVIDEAKLAGAKNVSVATLKTSSR